MAVANAILRQEIVSIRVGLLTPLCRVSWIPVKHQIGSRDRAKNFGCFSGRRGIARRFIFENENHIFLRCFFCSVAQFFIHGRAIRSLILEAPEIEKADAVGIESLGQLDAALEHFVLLLKREVCVELIALRTELRWGRPRPVHFEKRAGDIGYAQLVFFQDAASLVDFPGIKFQEVLIPHSPELHPFHAKFFRRYFARAAKVLSDLVVDDRNAEWRFHDRIHGCIAWDRGKRSYSRNHPEVMDKLTTRYALLHTGLSFLFRYYVNRSARPMLACIYPIARN